MACRLKNRLVPSFRIRAPASVEVLSAKSSRHDPFQRGSSSSEANASGSGLSVKRGPPGSPKTPSGAGGQR